MLTTVEPALVPPVISRGKTRALAVSRNRTDCQLLAILRLRLAMGEQAGTRRLTTLLPVTAPADTCAEQEYSASLPRPWEPSGVSWDEVKENPEVKQR